MTTPTDDAFFAGLMDSEGTLAVYPARKRVAVSFVTTCSRTRDWIVEKYGPVSISERQPSGISRKVLWQLTWTSGAAQRAVLSAIRPYLLTKAEAADAVAAFIDAMPGRGSPGVARKDTCLRGHPRTPDNVDRSGRCVTCKREQNREAQRRWRQRHRP